SCVLRVFQGGTWVRSFTLVIFRLVQRMRLYRKSSLKLETFSRRRSSPIATQAGAKASVLSRCLQIRKQPTLFRNLMAPNTAGGTCPSLKRVRWRRAKIAARVVDGAAGRVQPMKN